MLKIVAMYLAMCSQLIFPATDRRGEIEIRRIHSCKIEQSWSSLTDKATITLPRNIPEFNDGVRDLLRHGDPVVISLGYNGDLQEEFVGYIQRVSATVPVVIECEDEMFALKRIPVSKAYKKVSLKQLIADIAPGYKTDIADFELGAVRVQNTNAAEVLQLLKEKHIYSYFKGKTLVSGKIYLDDNGKDPVIFKPRNIINDSNLKFTLADENKMKVIAVSYLPGGKTLSSSIGEMDGVESRIAHYNITDKEQLKKLAQLDYDRLHRDGLTGSFEAWAIPVIRHGEKAQLIYEDFPERSGTYYCDGTVLTFSDQPYLHRTIKIGRRVNG